VTVAGTPKPTRTQLESAFCYALSIAEFYATAPGLELIDVMQKCV